MATVKFKPPARPDIPVLALSEAGQDMLVWSLVGAIEYKRADSEALASHLDQLAKMVREHS